MHPLPNKGLVCSTCKYTHPIGKTIFTGTTFQASPPTFPCHNKRVYPVSESLLPCSKDIENELYYYEKRLFDTGNKFNLDCIQAIEVKAHGNTPHDIAPRVEPEPEPEKDSLPPYHSPHKLGREPRIDWREGERYRVLDNPYTLSFLPFNWWRYNPTVLHTYQYIAATGHVPSVEGIFQATTNKEGETEISLTNKQLTAEQTTALHNFGFEVERYLTLPQYIQWLIGQIRKATYVFNGLGLDITPMEILLGEVRKGTLSTLPTRFYGEPTRIHLSESDVLDICAHASTLKPYKPRPRHVVFNPQAHLHPFKKLQIEQRCKAIINSRTIQAAYDSGAVSLSQLSTATGLSERTLKRHTSRMNLKVQDSRKATSQEKIKAWKAENPKGTQKDCATATGKGIATVKRYWKI